MTGWPAELRGALDEPVAGATYRRGPLWVRGWAPWFGSGPVRVDVRVDDRVAGLARIACPRPDLAALTAHPFAPLCGFEFLLDERALSREQHDVSVVARAGDGEPRRIGTATVHIGDQEDPPGPMPPRPAPRRVRPGRPLEVLAVSNDLGLGGAQRFLTELLPRLHGDGFRFRIVGLRGGEHQRWLAEDGISSTVVGPVPVDDPIAYERWLQGVEEHLDGVDLVLPNTLPTFPFADLATRAGIPVVWAVHESFGMRPFWEVGYAGTMHPRVRELAEDAFRHAGALTFNSPETARLYEGFADPERLLVIRYGLDLSRARPDHAAVRSEVRRTYGIDEIDPVLVCLGRIEPRKGQGMIAQAIERLADRHPRAHVLLVGAVEGDPLVPALGEYLLRAGLDRRVRIVPATPEPERLLAASDVVVCASDFEVLPFGVLEAMAMGLPAVSTAIFGIPEVVVEGETGYLCRPCDLDDLTRTLDLALSTRERWPRLGAAAAEIIRVRHPVEPFVEAFADLLRGSVRT